MGDARTERWRAHRVEMRRKLVDAAIRAIENSGPQVSMREIAAEAQVPKPTLYRFFKDKSELATAIADRAHDDIMVGLATARGRSPGTLGGLVHVALTGYASLLVDNPNVSRFLFLGVDNPGVKATENWRATAREVASMIAFVIDACGGADGDVSFHASMVVGAITAAAEWSFQGAGRAITADMFVARVEPATRAIIQIAGAEAGVAVDFDMPLPEPAT